MAALALYYCKGIFLLCLLKTSSLSTVITDLKRSHQKRSTRTRLFACWTFLVTARKTPFRLFPTTPLTRRIKTYATLFGRRTLFPVQWICSYEKGVPYLHRQVKIIGASTRNMPPKTPDDKHPKKKPSATKKTTVASKAVKKASNKTVPSAITKLPAKPQTKKESPTASYPSHSMALSQELRERIAQRAYDIHQRRGGQHGSDWEDWLQAEREILLQQPLRS